MKRDHHFMELALAEAAQALALGEFPVGCILVRDEEVIAVGRRTHSSETTNEIDHAEIMALRDLLSREPESDLSEVTLYCTMEPCLMCYSTLLLNGIRTIVYGYEDVMGGGTSLDLKALTPLYSAMRVELRGKVMRRECLALFQQFFGDDSQDYWDDSLLKKYTLEQECS